MQILRKFMLGTALSAALAIPLTALAFTGIPFGGTVLSMVPCVSPIGAAEWITIAPVGPTPIFAFVWTIATLGPPPIHTGQQILGVSDTTFGCTAGVAHFVGQRIQFDGVSI